MGRAQTAQSFRVRKGSVALRIAPWLIAGTVLAVIAAQYSLEEILVQVRRGSVLPMVPFALLGPFGYLAVVSFADRAVLRVLWPSLSYRDVFAGKGGTATLMALSYVFGGGAYGVWIARRTAVNAKVALGAMLFMLWSDLTAVCLLASIGMAASDAPPPRALWISATSIAGVQLLAIAVAIGARRGIARREVFTVWQRLDRGTAFLQVGIRVCAVSVSALAVWTGARAFGLELPFAHAAVHVPVALLVQSLPVNVAGFGAAQGVWLLAFERFASGEQILAFQFMWQLALNAAMVLRGLPFLRKTLDELRGTVQT